MVLAATLEIIYAVEMALEDPGTWFHQGIGILVVTDLRGNQEENPGQLTKPDCWLMVCTLIC